MNEFQAYEFVNNSKSGEANVAEKFKKLKVARKSKGKSKKKGKKTKKTTLRILELKAREIVSIVTSSDIGIEIVTSISKN